VEQFLTQKIEQLFPTLSKSQQRVAKLVLDDPTAVLLHSAAELGKRAATSETTVIRFCYTLGLTGYTQLQNEMTSTVVKTSSLGAYMASKESMSTKDHVAAEIMRDFSHQLEEIGQAIDEELFSVATEKLHHAKKIVLIGEGASYIAAQWFGFTLSMLRPNVQVGTKDSTSLIQLYRDADAETLVVIISLHRYYKESLEVTEHLQKLGAQVLAITDSSVAPVTRFADYCFALKGNQTSTIDLIPSVMAFLNTLVAGMMKQDMSYYKEQKEKYEQMHLLYLQKRWS